MLFFERQAACRLAGMLLLISLGWAAAAEAQPYNRNLQFLTVLPSPSGSEQVIRAVFRIETGPLTAPANLSTRVEFRRNGATLGSQIVPIILEFADGFCSSPPCIGACGSAILWGGEAQLLCHADCYHADCHCDCGAWLTAELPSGPLEPGDELTATLFPAPGAVPEPNPSDDSKEIAWQGGPVGWDRTVERIDLIPVPGHPDRYDVQVSGLVVFDGLPDEWMELSFLARLSRNGVALDSALIVHEAQSNDITCFQIGCGNYCGTHNGIGKTCDPVLFNGCGCGATWFTIYPGIEMEGEEVYLTVELVNTGSALPELNGRNDVLRLVGTSGAGGPEVRAANGLDPVRPNPVPSRGDGAVIGFSLAQASGARLDLIDVRGRIVRTLSEGELAAGSHTAWWDGRDRDGARAPGGVYFARLSTGGESFTRKLLIVE